MSAAQVFFRLMATRWLDNIVFSLAIASIGVMPLLIKAAPSSWTSPLVILWVGIIALSSVLSYSRGVQEGMHLYAKAQRPQEQGKTND